ncbi:MAG TPA: GNVR domain-containing protein [Terriglobia bacterium]|nr:GNVR domain-containing protein [Terriglobia bacterium]
MKIGIKSLQDFMAFLVRRKWWVIAPFVALSSIVAVLTKQLPRIYVSEALVMVQPRDVPENFVMNLISSSTEQRLKAIQQTALSRSNLVSILREYGDDLPEFRNFNLDEQVERLRDQIDIKFDLSQDARGNREVTSFKLSFQHKDPAVAQRIASRLTKKFIEQDSDTREKQVGGTTSFLQTEVEKLDAQLQKSDLDLKSLKVSHQNELPEQLDMNQRSLERLSAEQASNIDAVDRLTTSRFNYQQLLANTPEFLPPTSRQFTGSKSEEEDSHVEAYLKAKTAYEQLAASLPPNSKYQDLQILKVQMDRMKARLSPEELEEAQKPRKKSTEGQENKPIPNPQYISIQSALREIETEIGIRQTRKKQVEADIARLSLRVENTPSIELQMAEVKRQNEQLRKQREDRYSDLTKAELSQSLETNSKAGEFRIQDPANLPIEPSKPNKWAVLLAGCALSLALAIGIALAVDVARQRVWTQSEIESFWGVPVMVDIPEIVTDADQVELKKKRLTLGGTVLVGVLLYSIFLYGVYMKHNFILQSLDPVLQRVVYQ